MKRLALGLALFAAGCGGGSEPAPEASETAPLAPGPALGAEPAALPPQVADFPALASRDCAAVARFYLDALQAREFAKAALAWDDPVIDAARLEALFAGYRQPRIEPAQPAVEGAAGTLYCTVEGSLTDAADSATAASGGTLVLSRVNDVPGATPEQLRWRLRSSTFVEPLERSQRG